MRLLAVLLGLASLACFCGPSTFGGPGVEARAELLADARALRAEVRAAPLDASAHHALAKVYFELGEDAAAKAVLFRAMALAPEDPAILATVAQYTDRIADIPLEEAYAARDRLDAADATVASADPPVPAPTPAPEPTPAPNPTPSPVAAGGPRLGLYKCYVHGGGSTNYAFIDFTLMEGGAYRDKQGTRGTYSFDPGSRLLTFSGGLMGPYNGGMMKPTKIGVGEKPKRSSWNVICDLKT